VKEKLALGTVQFGLDYGIVNHSGQVKFEEVKKILRYAKKSNIDTLDTASSYGDSERILGKIGVEDCQIVTKTTPLKNNIDDVIDNFYKSLENLNTSQVNGLLIHDINDIDNKNFGQLFNKLKLLQDQGLIGKIGFSTYSPMQIDFLLNNFEFDLIQLPFNVFDTRLSKGGQLKALKDKGIEIHSRSIFLQGLLLNFENLPDYFSTWKRQFNDYQSIVNESELSLLEYAVNFVLNTQEIDKVLVGVINKCQLKEIVQAVKNKNGVKPYPIDDIKLINPNFWAI
jgi:aryl-alcohol dehydrogenase-like predicted oxidoreductase